MRRLLSVALTGALAGFIAPATAATTSRVDYWLDRDPGEWTGGMVVIRHGHKFWAYAKFFEGRVCLSGRKAGSTVRMKGTFEQYERERVRVTRWRGGPEAELAPTATGGRLSARRQQGHDSCPVVIAACGYPDLIAGEFVHQAVLVIDAA